MLKKLLVLAALISAGAAMAGPAASKPQQTDPPVIVATKLSGSVFVQSPSGSQRDLVSTQVLHSGDIVTTGDDSLAVIMLADVGRVTLGPTTTVTTFTKGTDLSMELGAGMLCVQTDRPGVSVNAGSITLAAVDRSTAFNLEQNTGDTKLAVYKGSVRAVTPDDSPITLRAGPAAASSSGVAVHEIPLASIAVDFAALNCPEVRP
jgi:ferric-dicitrate binding protein FerR (iron transport regulator)